MKRGEFLSTITGPISLACVACLASACSKEENGAPAAVNAPSPNSGFSVNLDTELKAVNNFVARSGIIVIRTASGNTAASFAAYSSVCPHAGATVEYNANSSSFLCAAHGSTFSSTGALIQGPATRGLTKLAVDISGTTLRVKA
ncbi:ubiquinol-cytochrome c reductase iron-sulfur subunit [Aquirufa sp.]|jgi:Rieske Fe-S protein|uniref:ubiquinol-cytochrome c reductase iron-sulfur subunit n=1 Tax=Aquirufa sp. TaxID=2676249 RepID=UPI0037BFC10C